VIPDAFDYAEAHSIVEAVELLGHYRDDAKILAGGHSLIPLLRFRLAAPTVLIDISKVDELEYMHEADGALHIGAMTRESALDTSSLILERYPILHDTAMSIADPTVRNWATIGGNLAHADPANDHPATMLALNASIVITGPAGQRVIPVTEFFTDIAFETALQPDELLTEIRIPMPGERAGSAYVKLKRKIGDYAIIGVAACVELDTNGVVTQAGIALTNAAPYSIKARDAEQFLVGKSLDDATLHQVADLAAADAHPLSDGRGPAEYKQAMVRTLCVRALRLALARANGRDL
jgi:carbon-monoxide dehydrogenase medium subunit